MADAPVSEGHDPERRQAHPVNRLILEIAESRREASKEEIQLIREHVASVGYEPGSESKAGSRIAGLVWQGRIIESGSRLSNALVHYLRHVVAQAEWHPDTSLDEYLASLRAVIEDPGGGILLTHRFGAWLLTFVSRAAETEEIANARWIAVGYGVNYGYWITGYRPRSGLEHFTPNMDEGERWLRQPRSQNV